MTDATTTELQNKKGVAYGVDAALELTTHPDGLLVAVSLYNRTDDDITLGSNDGTLLNVALKNKQRDDIWNSNVMTTQASTSWTLPAHTRHTEHYVIPDAETARAEKKEESRDIAESWLDSDTRDLPVDTMEELTIDVYTAPAHEIPDLREEVYQDTENNGLIDDDGHLRAFESAVDTDELGIVIARASLPQTNGTWMSLSRQFDLRTNLRDLDDSVHDAVQGVERSTFSSEPGDINTRSWSNAVWGDDNDD